MSKQIEHYICMGSRVSKSELHVVVRRRRMTTRQHDRLRRAARKMLQDFRKFVRRKGL